MTELTQIPAFRSGHHDALGKFENALCATGQGMILFKDRQNAER